MFNVSETLKRQEGRTIKKIENIQENRAYRIYFTDGGYAEFSGGISSMNGKQWASIFVFDERQDNP
jgi:predicted nucleic-acid-binding Zn-ribbon protein